MGIASDNDVVVNDTGDNNDMMGSTDTSVFDSDIGDSDEVKGAGETADISESDSDLGDEVDDIQSVDDFQLSVDKDVKNDRRLFCSLPEKSLSKLLGVTSAVSIYVSDSVPIDDILISDFKKDARQDTLLGLGKLISECGGKTFQYIHVMQLEDDNRYILLDGMRILLALTRSRNTTVPAMIWNFEDKDEAKQNVYPLSLLINRSQNFTVKEKWSMLKQLEQTNNLTPDTLEFLLQLDAGDAMKLKDVMTADKVGYAEIQDNLMSGKWSIDQAYKKLCKQRKEEDRLAKEEEVGVDLTSQTGEYENPDDTSVDDNKISVDEASKILDLADSDVDNVSFDDLNKSNEASEVEVQDTKNRHIVDKAIKQAVFIRDDFHCRCCGIGGANMLGILIFHHIIPVYLGGPDTKKNGLTLCQNCHMLLHQYVSGEVHVDESVMRNDIERNTFKNIFKYGNLLLDAAKSVHKGKKDIHEIDTSGTRHAFPNENVKENKSLFVAKDSSESSDGAKVPADTTDNK